MDSRAVTFCTCELLPAKSNVTVLAERSNCTLTVLTLTVELLKHDVKPDICKMSAASTPTGRVPRRQSVVMARHGWCHNLIVVVMWQYHRSKKGGRG